MQALCQLSYSPVMGLFTLSVAGRGPTFQTPSVGMVGGMPSRFVLKSMNAVHSTLMKASGGRWGWEFGVNKTLILTTTGRKSGQPRTVHLTSPVQQGDTWVLVASKGGDPSHPDWYLNIQANPTVTVETKAHGRVQTTARVVDAAERASLWPQITAAAAQYAGYQKKTDREIPVLVVTVNSSK